MEDTRQFSLQFIRDEAGKLLSDPHEILQRWKLHFESLLNGSSGKLNPATLDLVAEHPLKQALDADPSVAEVEQALRQLENGRAWARTAYRPNYSSWSTEEATIS